MKRLDRRELGLWALGLGVAALALMIGISSFGIWDPWELEVADAARSRLDGAPVTGGASALTVWLVSVGFRLFGIHEWSGRWPIAMMGILTLVFVAFLVRRYEGKRAAAFTFIVAATSPLFLLNSRQMLGDAGAFAGQSLLALGLFAAAYPVHPEERKRWRWGWLAAAAAGFALSAYARGALLGASPPLLALGLLLALRGDLLRKHRADAAVSVGIMAAGLVLAALIGRSVLLDRSGYDWLLGGTPRGGNPPVFDEGFEAIFHAFAPWSALILPAMARMLWPGAGAASEEGGEDAAEGARMTADGRAALRLFVALWAALAYGAMTLFSSRYGAPSYLALGALSAAVGVTLADVETSKRSWGIAAVIACLFTGLLIRDYDLYPAGPVAGLPVEAIEVPEVFNPKLWWTLTLGLFALTVVVSFGPTPGEGQLDFRAPYRTLRATFRRGPLEKVWIVSAGALAVALLVFSLLSWVSPEALHLNSLAVRIGRKIGLLPLLLAPAVAAGQAAYFAVRKLGSLRVVPVLLAGTLVGAYTAHGYEPALSAHLSPREVYDSYNALAAEGEALGEFRVGGRAAAYYARGEIEELATQAELLAFLARPGRRWAVFPADQLPAIDRAYRRQAGHHMYVADAESARVVLVASEPVEGREDQNFLTTTVLSEAPTPQHPVGARFDDKIELVGYDLELPHEGYVGAGETFTVIWIWRALSSSIGSYKSFLHVDGAGNRLNGDHDPVDGKYPVRLWEEGDVILDRQTLTVSANFRPGDYRFMIGFFSGSNRMTVVSGDHDEANRVNAGVLHVR